MAAQYNSRLHVTIPVFPEIIPREDTGSRDKESDQRVSHEAQAEADFKKLLEEINAAIEGAGVIILDTSKAKFQGAFCGKGLLDVAVQEAGVTPNLIQCIPRKMQGSGLMWAHLCWALNQGVIQLMSVNKKGPIEFHAKGIRVVS